MSTAAGPPAPGLPMASRPWLDGPLLPVAIAWLAIVVLLWSTFVDMWHVWGASGTFAHGYVIFPISLYLLWRRRERWLDLPLQPHWAGMLAVAGAVLLWLAGSLLHLNVVMQLAAVIIIAAVEPAGHRPLRPIPPLAAASNARRPGPDRGRRAA